MPAELPVEARGAGPARLHLDQTRQRFCNMNLSSTRRSGGLADGPHEAFWQCIDVPKEAPDLNARWQPGRAPWKIWT